MKKYVALCLLIAFSVFNFAPFAYGVEQTEHLLNSKKVEKKSPTNLVKKEENSVTILEYNVIEASFAQDFSTKTAKVGDKVDFLLNSGLQTKEGTKLLPDGTKLVTQISNIIKPKSFNRSGKVSLEFIEFVKPDGTIIPVEAKIFNNKGYLSRGKLNALGKGLGTTLGLGAVGVGAGCGIGVAASAVIVGGFAIGLPIGIAVGALAGLVTPGLHYKAKAGDTILFQLLDDVSIAQ
ncbi:MAG: hypothetical protein E7Z91_04965 [Cyanobacteria bacterium SIG30]|nr:hypothetical protein [Cyanobacteria bacterium SIG30]